MVSVDSATSTILSSLVVYASLCFITLLIFERSKGQKAIYAPRLLDDHGTRPGVAKRGPLSYFTQALLTSDEETLAIVGYDGYIFLRFLRLLCKITIFCSLCGFIILIPVYCTAPLHPLDQGLNKFSMGNIQTQGSRLWIPLIFTYIFTGIFLHLLHSEYKTFATLRQHYFKYPKGSYNYPLQASYSCRIENIPNEIRTEHSLYSVFNRIFPNQIHSISLMQYTLIGDKILQEKETYIDKYEKVVSQYEGSNHTLIPYVLIDGDNNIVDHPINICQYHINQLYHKMLTLLTSRTNKNSSTDVMKGNKDHSLENNNNNQQQQQQQQQHHSNNSSSGGGSSSVILPYDQIVNSSGSNKSSSSLTTKLISDDLVNEEEPQGINNLDGANDMSGNTEEYQYVQAIPYYYSKIFELSHELRMWQYLLLRQNNTIQDMKTSKAMEIQYYLQKWSNSVTTIWFDVPTYVHTQIQKLTPRLSSFSPRISLSSRNVILTPEHCNDENTEYQSSTPMINTNKESSTSIPVERNSTNSCSSSSNDKKLNHLKHPSSTQQSSSPSYHDNITLLNNIKQYTSTAFITFKSRHTQILATQLPALSDEYPQLKVFPAYAPYDNIWENIIRKKATSENIHRFIVILLYTGILFWSVIISALGAITNLSNLEQYFPRIKTLDPVTYSIIAGILPVLFLNTLMILLPSIFKFLAYYVEGKKLYYDVENMVCQWYFLYTITNVYVSVAAGSVFNTLQNAIQSPLSIIFLAGSSIPNVSIFFINILLSKWLVGLSVTLVRLVPCFTVFFYTYCRNEKKLTIRELLNGPFAVSYYDYGSGIPEVLYVTIIVLLYWIISPIVMGVGTLYFLFAYIILKYQLLYIYVPRYHTGGEIFYSLYGYTMVGLLTSSLAIIGFMGIKEGITQTPLLVPLPIIIIIVWRYTESKYKDLSMNMAYRRAMEIDESLLLSSYSSKNHSGNSVKQGTHTGTSSTIYNTHSSKKSHPKVPYMNFPIVSSPTLTSTLESPSMSTPVTPLLPQYHHHHQYIPPPPPPMPLYDNHTTHIDGNHIANSSHKIKSDITSDNAHDYNDELNKSVSSKSYLNNKQSNKSNHFTSNLFTHQPLNEDNNHNGNTQKYINYNTMNRIGTVKDIYSMTNEEVLAQFDKNLYKQPALQKQACIPKVLPYRLYQQPLFTVKNRFNPTYYNIWTSYDHIRQSKTHHHDVHRRESECSIVHVPTSQQESYTHHSPSHDNNDDDDNSDIENGSIHTVHNINTLQSPLIMYQESVETYNRQYCIDHNTCTTCKHKNGNKTHTPNKSHINLTTTTTTTPNTTTPNKPYVSPPFYSFDENDDMEEDDIYDDIYDDDHSSIGRPSELDNIQYIYSNINHPTMMSSHTHTHHSSSPPHPTPSMNHTNVSVSNLEYDTTDITLTTTIDNNYNNTTTTTTTNDNNNNKDNDSSSSNSSSSNSSSSNSIINVSNSNNLAVNNNTSTTDMTSTTNIMPQLRPNQLNFDT